MIDMIYSLGASNVLARMPRQLGFRVPEEDHDSYSDQSREGSVQVIESHPRTYSIPSSSDEETDSDEDDEIEIASSVHGDENRGSTPTTPDRGNGFKKHAPHEVEAKTPETGLSHSEVRELNLKGPSLHDLLSKPATLGASPKNPIDLEGASAAKNDAPDTESEDDGPDILPIPQPLPTFMEGSGWQEMQPPCQQNNPPAASGDLDTQDQVKRIILETQAHVSKEETPMRQNSLEMLTESLTEATDGFDSEDDDGFDQDDDFSDFNPDKDIENDFALLQHEQPRQEPMDTIYPNPRSSSRRDEGYSQHITYGYNHGHILPISMSEGIDVSQPTVGYIAHHQSAHRAPSPSDAALARKAKDPKPTLYQSHNSSADFEFDPATFEDSSSVNGPVRRSAIAVAPGSYSYPELKSPELSSKPYDQGPFSTRYISSSLQSQIPRVIYDNAPAPLYHSQSTSDVTFHGVNHDSTSYSEPRKASDAPYSKLNIASIVNAPSENSSKRSKRKAEDMCSGAEEESSSPPAVESLLQAPRQPPPPSPYSGNTQNNESLLPDAQPRDNLLPVEVAPLSQSSILESNVQSTSATTATQPETLEGPPRKKAKTSSSSSGVMGFVSGVCLGLAAAVAGFVATIPSSVHEEALRELANGI